MTNQLIVRTDLTPAVLNAVELWAESTTDQMTTRYKDLLRDKAGAIVGFFEFVGKAPQEVTPGDVRAWIDNLKAQGLAGSTVYNRVSKVSSFYNWLATEAPGLGILLNPVKLARPKAPKAYQTESTKALSEKEVSALIDVLRAAAETSIVGKRDLAIFTLLMTTGIRRSEALGLTWGDLDLDNGHMIMSIRVKGGDIVNKVVEAASVKSAMLNYLEAAGRLDSMVEDSPIWTAHDKSGANTGNPLTGHAFAKNLKKYAEAAGVDHINIHQTRHTFAAKLAELTGSVSVVQEKLGHKNPQTTRVYVQRIGIQQDGVSVAIADAFGL